MIVRNSQEIIMQISQQDSIHFMELGIAIDINDFSVITIQMLQIPKQNRNKFIYQTIN